MGVGNIKLCLVIDKHAAGVWGSAPIPKKKVRELLERADAYEVRRPYLKTILQIRRGEREGVELEGLERELLVAVATSGKEIVYHGAGIVEDVIVHVESQDQRGRVLKDESFSTFVDEGCLEDLNELSVQLASFHFELAVRRVYAAGRRDWAMEEPITEEEWGSVFGERLRTLRSRYHGKVAFENSSFYRDAPYPKYINDPRFLAGVFERFTEIGFLLDFAHSRISAFEMGMRDRDYLGILPLERIVALHFSSAEMREGRLNGGHGVPTTVDYGLLRWVLDQGASPAYLTLEHYNEDEEIMSFDRVREFLAGL